IRRDIKSFQFAWVFSAADESFICKAATTEYINALVKTDAEKGQLKAAIAEKRKEEKLIKGFLSGNKAPAPAAAMDNLARAAKALCGPMPKAPQRKHRITLTPMDTVIAAEKREAEAGGGMTQQSGKT